MFIWVNVGIHIIYCGDDGITSCLFIFTVIGVLTLEIAFATVRRILINTKRSNRREKSQKQHY